MPVIRLVFAFALTAPLSSPSMAFQTSSDEALKAVAQSYATLDDHATLAMVNSFLVNNPMNLAGSVLRARLLLRLERHADAVRTLELLPNPPARARLLLAECLGLSGDLEQANKIVDEVMLNDASMMAPRITQARLLMLQGRPDQAASILQLVLQKNQANADATVSMAMALEGMRRFPDALNMYGKYIGNLSQYNEHDPHLQRDAIEGMARVNSTVGKYEDALFYYQQLASRLPMNPMYPFRIGVCHGMLNRFEDAVTSMRKAIDMEPTNPMFRLRLGEMFTSQKRIDEAIEQFMALAEMSEDPRLPSLRLAELYLTKNDLKRAKEHADNVLLLEPESADVQEVAGLVLERMGKPLEAMAAFQKAFSKDSMKFQSMYRLGLLLRKHGTTDEQKATSAALLARYNKIAPFLGDIDQAKSEVNMNRNNPAYTLKLASLLNEAEEYETAKRWIGSAIQRAPSDPKVLAMGGCIAANSGENGTALELFEKAQGALPAANDQLTSYINSLKSGAELPLPLGQVFRRTDPNAKDGGRP